MHLGIIRAAEIDHSDPGTLEDMHSRQTCRSSEHTLPDPAVFHGECRIRGLRRAVRQMDDFAVGGAAETDREAGDGSGVAVTDSLEQPQFVERCGAGLVDQFAGQAARIVDSRLDDADPHAEAA